jgi:hypothetical protein
MASVSQVVICIKQPLSPLPEKMISHPLCRAKPICYLFCASYQDSKSKTAERR